MSSMALYSAIEAVNIHFFSLRFSKLLKFLAGNNFELERLASLFQRRINFNSASTKMKINFLISPVFAVYPTCWYNIYFDSWAQYARAFSIKKLKMRFSTFQMWIISHKFIYKTRETFLGGFLKWRSNIFATKANFLTSLKISNFFVTNR